VDQHITPHRLTQAQAADSDVDADALAEQLAAVAAMDEDLTAGGRLQATSSAPRGGGEGAACGTTGPPGRLVAQCTSRLPTKLQRWPLMQIPSVLSALASAMAAGACPSLAVQGQGQVPEPVWEVLQPPAAHSSPACCYRSYSSSCRELLLAHLPTQQHAAWLKPLAKWWCSARDRARSCCWRKTEI